MTRRAPVLISTVTAMPGDERHSLPSTASACGRARRARHRPAPAPAARCRCLRSLDSACCRRRRRWLAAVDRIRRDAQHLAVEQAVSGEIEGIDLDLGLLAGVDEADVAVRHHRLDLELAVERHHHEQRLRRRHDAAHRMHRELLHDAVDRRGQASAARCARSALITSCASPPPSARPSPSSPKRVRRYSASVCARVSSIAASAASASRSGSSAPPAPAAARPAAADVSR